MDNAVTASLIISVKKFVLTTKNTPELEDSPEDLIKSIAQLYAGPDRDIETDEEAIN